MTAPIVYFDVRHLERREFPELRLSADVNVIMNRSVPGQLWSRVAEGRKQVWS
jgi:hypothetical protein